MCSAPDIPPPPPPAPAPPPMLAQLAPKSASGSSSGTARNKSGMSRYKIDAGTKATQKTGSSSTALGGIPKKTGV